jgi:hypothetical protein
MSYHKLLVIAVERTRSHETYKTKLDLRRVRIVEYGITLHYGLCNRAQTNTENCALRQSRQVEAKHLSGRQDDGLSGPAK